MNTVEKFHNYNETCKNNQINDKNTIKSNIIFDVIFREDTDRGHTAP
jgi:hypothetical protein